MPTYEYRCDACGHEFELFQSIKSAPVKKCPKCGKSKAKRLISAGAGLLFKGSGFYITDYRSDSYNSAAKADSSSGESKPASSDSKPSSDAKPASDSKPAASDSKPAPAKSESKSESKPSKKSDGKK